MFAFLPFQVNAHKFVIPYYVMTRDIRRDLAAEKITVTVKGLFGNCAKVTAYDPLVDRRKEIRVLASNDGLLELEVAATDHLVRLEVEEAH